MDMILYLSPLKPSFFRGGILVQLTCTWRARYAAALSAGRLRLRVEKTSDLTSCTISTVCQTTFSQLLEL